MRQRDRPLARSGLRGLERPSAVVIAAELLDDLELAVEEVDAVATQPGHLAEAEPAVRADEHERPVPLIDRPGQAGHLVGFKDAHLALLNPGRLDSVEWVAHQEVVLDGSGERPAQRSVRLMDRRRLEVTGGQAGEPGTQHRLVEPTERNVAEHGQDVEPKVVEVNTA